MKKLLERQPQAPDQRLFVNRYGEPLSTSGVRFKLAAYVKAAAETMPSLQTKHVTPHSFRHATAVHLVSAGVDITVIRSWLGHVSLDTHQSLREGQSGNQAKGTGTGRCSDNGRSSAILET
ncbi:tyrosine-type recombinase/integrase [Brucella sp. HL-2]|nr:tyrosine-type recombinase/integrase [Brucella sp. HL-2]MCV9910509.1 tyrosine-type recombinase/integrase [Brucella sp. HL-2]